jgi:hypothetical protein
MRLSLPAILALLLVLSACGSTPTEPAPTTTTPTNVTELFTGAVAPGGSTFYSFSVSQGGTVSLMLATTTSEAGLPLVRTLRLGVGVPAGTGCGLTSTVNATAALASQISNFMNAGTYCVDVADNGTLSDTVNFNVRIVHP